MAQTPRADEGLICPLHKKDMSTVCHKCPWWYQVRGKDPQSDREIDEWRCAIGLLPLLMIETAQMTRQAGASSDKIATEVFKLRSTVIQLSDPAAIARRSAPLISGETSS